MGRNLSPPPNCDVVQGTLPLEPSKRTFNAPPLLQQRLAFEGVLDTVESQATPLRRKAAAHGSTR